MPFYLQLSRGRTLSSLPLRWKRAIDILIRLKLILFEKWRNCWVDESKGMSIRLFLLSNINRVDWQGIGLLIYRSFILRLEDRGREAAGTQNFRAHTHTFMRTHTHTHIRSACTRITYTYSERFECLRGAGIHPLSFYYPLSSFCSPVLCASRERSTESDVPLLRLLKWPPKRRLVSIPVR